MAENRLRRVFMKDAAGKEDVVLDHCPEGGEAERARHLQRLGASAGRNLSVRVTSVDGHEVLADLPAIRQ